MPPQQYLSPSVCVAWRASEGRRRIVSPLAFLAISLADSHSDGSNSLNLCAIAVAAGGRLVLVSSQLSLADNECIPKRVRHIAGLHAAQGYSVVIQRPLGWGLCSLP